MMRLILAYSTFPGVIVHEFAHAWACRMLGISVFKVCYLRFGNPLGYVLHERPAYVFQHIMVAIAPFFVSTFLALTVSSMACLLFVNHSLSEFHDLIIPLALWLGFSLALHAFPSSGDADALWDEVRSRQVGFCAKLLLVPVVGLIRLTGLGAYIGLDALYAMAVVALPPLILLSFTI
jgi:hypothetical protein